MSEWISVEHQLPDFGEKVIIVGDSDVTIATFEKIGFVEQCDGFKYINEYTSYWQPRPKPPKPTNLIDSFIADGGFDKAINEVK
ncbi:DUF551 domain-containing protein [Acinetobacter sp. B10A]|uniref:DUF551 domain-containing protein n=1 Tax=Acinetobacter baretiae TaxID=2605383 RepID=UPI001B3C7700|nr:DUF551 domain-containing protein [Acinetobacter baretiae]MBF7685907.1 DUF551 domain-containing protein [Acinetobacter baretiae]